MTVQTGKKLEFWPLDKLTAYKNNARTHSEEQISQLANSMAEFGFTNPILVDANNEIIAGHGRLMAAKFLQMRTVPVIVLPHLTDAQRRAYIIADNKLALNAGWDDKLLAEELDRLGAEDFDLSLLGFSDDELEDLAIKDENEGEEESSEEEAPEVPEVAVTLPGDIWLLGQHRLMCGDSTNSKSVNRLLAGAKPNLMVTDPPYGVQYEAGWRAEAKGVKKTKREKTSNLKHDDRADWYDAWMLFPGNVAYVWHASAYTDVVMDSLRRAEFEIKQQIIWNKNVHALSRSSYHWKHEPCWYAVREGKNANWLAGRDQMTIWDVRSVIFEKDKTAHPTQKPLGIYETPISNHTEKGDITYEPFGGSGTAIIACENLGRISYTMEFDPKFCDVIVQRWQQKTGKEATLEESDMTFSEVEKERLHVAIEEA